MKEGGGRREEEAGGRRGEEVGGRMQACFPPFGQTFECFGKQHSSLFTAQSSAPNYIKVSVKLLF